jgi:hypothetical protein
LDELDVIIVASAEAIGVTMSEFPGYGQEHEETMRWYFRSLPEDHRRRYTGIEALKIGLGGIAYIARVLGMSRGTIYAGIREPDAMGEDGGGPPRRPNGDAKRVRRPGGGRPKAAQRQAALAQTFEAILEAHSAGSPSCVQEHLRSGGPYLTCNNGRNDHPPTVGALIGTRARTSSHPSRIECGLEPSPPLAQPPDPAGPLCQRRGMRLTRR